MDDKKALIRAEDMEKRCFFLLSVSYQRRTAQRQHSSQRRSAWTPCCLTMMETAGVTEELKARDPMRWVGLMNTLKAQAEEIIFQELISA